MSIPLVCIPPPFFYMRVREERVASGIFGTMTNDRISFYLSSSLAANYFFPSGFYQHLKFPVSPVTWTLVFHLPCPHRPLWKGVCVSSKNEVRATYRCSLSAFPLHLFSFHSSEKWSLMLWWKEKKDRLWCSKIRPEL